MKEVFQTKGHVVIFPSSGTGAWEAALTNTLSPGDKILMFESGHFATLWIEMARRLGLDVDVVPTDWRHAPDPQVIEAKLAEDRGHKIKAVCVVHNETSTGVTSRVAAIREAINRTHHPALFLVDTISSLASIDFRHDEWQVDVTVTGSQKGLMLPPGLGFNAVSEKALAASKSAKLPRAYWEWEPMIKQNAAGFFPVYTGYQSAVRPARGAAHAARRRLEERICAAPSPWGSHAARRQSLGSGKCDARFAGISATR